MLYLNGKPVDFGQFPNKESYLPIKELDVRPTNKVKFDYTEDGDIILLGMLKQWLDDMKATAELYISYMPYSRMDRPNGEYSVALKMMAQLINDMEFTSVTVREPHSEATLGALKNAGADWWVADRIRTVVKMSYADTLFYPDDGALKRYDTSETGMSFAVGSKKRTFGTGNIDEYSIKGDVGINVLIMDDLCSRGGTFIRAAMLLKEQGARHVELLVAHCENNVFTGEVFNYIDRIYTSKEMLDKDHPRITKID